MNCEWCGGRLKAEALDCHRCAGPVEKGDGSWVDPVKEIRWQTGIGVLPSESAHEVMRKVGLKIKPRPPLSITE